MYALPQNHWKQSSKMSLGYQNICQRHCDTLETWCKFEELCKGTITESVSWWDTYGTIDNRRLFKRHLSYRALVRTSLSIRRRKFQNDVTPSLYKLKLRPSRISSHYCSHHVRQAHYQTNWCSSDVLMLNIIEQNNAVYDVIDSWV